MCSGRSPEKILEYRARKVGGMGKMGDLGGNGEGRRRKKWWKGEDFFWEKKFFFIPPRSVHYGCDRVLLLTTLYGGARRRLVEGFYEVSDMELLIGVGWK